MFINLRSICHRSLSAGTERRPANRNMLVRPGQTFKGTQRKLLQLIEEFDPGSD
jgi:hypothetical protein